MLDCTVSTEESSDQKFMKNIFDRYYITMKKKAFEITNNQNSVEDIVSESFLRLIKHINTIKKLNSKKQAAYVMITVRNTAINYIHQNTKMSEISYMGNENDISDQIMDRTLEPQFILDSKTQYKKLCKAINDLSDRERNLLIYKYIFEMSDQEISKELKTKPNNIRQYLTRARRHAHKIILEGKE